MAARIKRGERERLPEKRERTRIPTHDFIVLYTAPLGVHRHLRAIETAVKRRREKAGRPANVSVRGAGKQIQQSFLVGRLDSEDVDHSDHAADLRKSVHRTIEGVASRETP